MHWIIYYIYYGGLLDEEIYRIITSIGDSLNKNFEEFFEKGTDFQFDHKSVIDFIEFYYLIHEESRHMKKKEKKFVELFYNYLSSTRNPVTINCNDILDFNFLSIFNIWYNYPLYRKKSKVFLRKVFHGYNFRSLKNKQWSDLMNEVEKFRTHFEINNKSITDRDLDHLSLLITIDTYPSNKLISPQRKSIYITWLSAAKNYISSVLKKRHPEAKTETNIDLFIYHSPTNVKGSVIRNVALQGMKDHFMVFHDDDDKARSLIGIINIIDDVLSNRDYTEKIQNPAYPYIRTYPDDMIHTAWSYILIRPTWIENDYCYSPFFMMGEDNILHTTIRADARYKDVPDRLNWFESLKIDANTYRYGYSYFYLLEGNRYSRDQPSKDWNIVWQTSVKGEQFALDKSQFKKHDHHIDEIIPINVIHETGEEEEVRFWAGIRKHRKVKMKDIPDYKEFNENLSHEREYVLHGGKLKYILMLFIKISAFICLIIIIVCFICNPILKMKSSDQQFI